VADAATPGTLFVVATPLGNLEDLSPRGSRILASVSLVACEDTRRTRRLLARAGIETATVSCHRFNERTRLAPVLERLRKGDDVALVSDGGTPSVSDPGALLVRAALSEGLRVVAVPGPSAVVAALSVSGFPADRFVFDGFLPHRGGERRRRLRELAGERRTMVLFETPHRILDALDDIEAILGEREIVLCRELTKVHETVLRGTAGRIREEIATGTIRGEIVVVIGDAPGAAAREDGTVSSAFARELRAAGGDRREALKKTARLLGMKRSELWRRLAETGEMEPPE